MRKDIAKALRKACEDMAFEFSKKDRDRNYAKEDYTVTEVVPLSEFTAACIYDKSTGKQAIAFFYYRKDRWLGFFPKDSHILGFLAFPKYKERIEKKNWLKNFEEFDAI